MNFKFNKDKIKRHVEEMLRQRFARVGMLLVNEIKDRTGTETKLAGPSRPGEYPHRDTGKFHKSLYWKLLRNGIRVGATVSYSRDLEKTRPFLNRTIQSMKSEIMKEMKE